MELNTEQWKQIHKLDQSTICTIYSMYQNSFLVEVREKLSEWIEARFLDSNLDSNNPSHHPYILQLIGDLDTEIRAKADSLSTLNADSFFSPVKLSIAANMISSGSLMNPITLFQHICHCLQTEREFIRQYSMSQETSQTQSASESTQTLILYSELGILDMTVNLDDLKMKISKMNQILHEIHSTQEDLIIKANALENIERTISQYSVNGLMQPNQAILGDRELMDTFLDEKNKMELRILDRASSFNTKLTAWQTLQVELFRSLKTMQGEALKCLSNWKEEQEKRSHHVSSIEQIQQRFDGLVQVIADFMNHLLKCLAVERSYNNMPALAKNVIASGNILKNIGQDYENQITPILNELIQHAFIVESQPQYLLKKGEKIVAKVRFLIGRSLQLPMSLQSVQASILNETGVKDFISNKGFGPLITCGELVNALQKFQLDDDGSGYIADFSNLQIKTIKRRKMKGNGDAILDDLYWLIFRAEFIHNSVTHKISALSAPTKIVSNRNKGVRALETLIWDAADKSQISESVPWTQLAKILNKRFKRMTKNRLTENQMKAIEDKAFSVPGGINPINGVKYLTRAQFCETKIPNTGFTFWNWFYEIAKLTSEHLCGLWQDNLIIGFISRERSKDILKSIGQHGMFLLRFSESYLGAISIAWVHPERGVRNVMPFTAKDLSYRPLAERIVDIENLLTLYPNKEKLQLFKPYILPHRLSSFDNDNMKGYDRSKLEAIDKDQDATAIITLDMSPRPGVSSSQNTEFCISEYSCRAGVSVEEWDISQPMNSVHTSGATSDDWIKDYLNDSLDTAEVGFSMEAYVFNSDDYSYLADLESI